MESGLALCGPIKVPVFLKAERKERKDRNSTASDKESHCSDSRRFLKEKLSELSGMCGPPERICPAALK